MTILRHGTSKTIRQVICRQLHFPETRVICWWKKIKLMTTLTGRWDGTPYSLVDIKQCFRETFCLILKAEEENLLMTLQPVKM
jgi:hypothetical protein